MRSLPTLAATIVMLGGALAPTASAAPTDEGACSATEGVTVVVQHGSQTAVRCAPGDPTSSASALADAGFSVDRVQGQKGLVCRIDDAPKTSCTTMPEAEKFWAFHLAQPGGKWTFATTGVDEHDPKPGSVVGFRLGAGDPPGGTAPTAAAEKSGSSKETSDETKAPDADSGSDGGALVPTAIGGGLFLALGIGAFAVARKRRN